MKYNILIVEDELHLARQYSECLSEFGEIIQVSNSEETFTYIKNKIDLIILDNKLIGDPRFPQDHAGLKILKVIKKEMKLNIPVIMITAYPRKKGEITTGQEAINIGAYEYLEKPIILSELKKVVKKALFNS